MNGRKALIIAFVIMTIDLLLFVGVYVKARNDIARYVNPPQVENFEIRLHNIHISRNMFSFIFDISPKKKKKIPFVIRSHYLLWDLYIGEIFPLNKRLYAKNGVNERLLGY
ncbi:hypothetical protein UABAM_03997 [Candidatus Uabimicrobium amorphum]|uniref:Uncharacterized protein n=1 Tax=Uabimicrobium amorphum TaxID=2596890 RepID=A0A5S9F4Z6_UABAM|nr:hypothetical protein UABAM_03997 [Candidatus Uabimicrobium amorphum]